MINPTHPRRVQATGDDLALLDLLKIYPGSSITSLSKITGSSRTTVSQRVMILVASGQATIQRVQQGRERTKKVVYPLKRNK
jgi:hypothetical protein